MSRLDKAIAALDGAVSDLTAAVDARLAADNEAQNAQLNEIAYGASGIAVEDLRAMKSELHEAMSLLQAMQDEPQNQECQ